MNKRQFEGQPEQNDQMELEEVLVGVSNFVGVLLYRQIDFSA